MTTRNALTSPLRLLLVLALLLGSLFVATSPTQAATTVPVGTHSVTFYFVRYDYPQPGMSTWYYSVSSVSGNAISHVVFELCPLTLLGAGTWNGPNDPNTLYAGEGQPVPSSFPSAPARDGSTGVVGIKFNQGFTNGQTRYYYFTVDANYAPTDINVVVKAGNAAPSAKITGPSCSIRPAAVTVSRFEAQRENDTLRFRWTTESEINNLGFDLFAVQPGGSEWIQINESFIPFQPGSSPVESRDYYYQVERPDIAVGASFYLRAYDADGTYEDFGPVSAVYTAWVAVPELPAPQPKPEPSRPAMNARRAPVELPVLPEPPQPQEPAPEPAQPIVVVPEPPATEPVGRGLIGAPRIGTNAVSVP